MKPSWNRDFFILAWWDFEALELKDSKLVLF